MACADALVAPRPNEPTIAKPAIESLLALAVILQLLCCLLRSSNEPNSLHGGSRFPAGSCQIFGSSFSGDGLAIRTSQNVVERAVACHSAVGSALKPMPGTVFVDFVQRGETKLISVTSDVTWSAE